MIRLQVHEQQWLVVVECEVGGIQVETRTLAHKHMSIIHCNTHSHTHAHTHGRTHARTHAHTHTHTPVRCLPG